MASYTSPALPENRDSRTNPLRPVDYTPNHTYISSPHSANSDRKGQSLSQNQQQQWPQQHYPQRTQHNNSEQGTAIPRSNTLRDPAAQQRLAMQLEYQRSLAKISLGDEDNAIHTTAESYSHPTAEIYSHPSQSNYSAATIPTTSAVGQAMANLGLASPSSFSTHKHPTTTQAPLSYVQMQSQHIDSSAPIVYQPQQHQHHHQQQQGPLHVSMALNYPPAYTQPQQSPLGPGQPHHQHNQQQQIPQQRVLHQSHEQQPYYPDSALSPKIPSSYTGSQIYSPTFNSSTMSGSWSQSSLSSHTLGSYSTHSSIHGSFNSHYSHPPPLQLSTRAQLLIDFNPSILSTIAVAFRQQMLDNESKRSESESYGLEFPVTFTGKEAIDVLIELTKLQDRRHGLSIARSMEHQLLFFGGGDNKLFDSNNDQYFFSELALAYLPGKSDFPTVPTGVFPYSAKCYSYGCIPGDSTCYSYLCPNRRHIANALGRHNSGASSVGSQEKVWANSVSASVVASASKEERNRQEAIFEVVNTEHNYVRDLELMEEIFITPLRSGDIVEPDRVEALIEDIFLNYKEILGLNKRLLEDMRIRQEQQPLVERIGDTLLSHIAGFEDAYTRYIPRIVLSEFASKREEAQNPKFAQFLNDCTRHPEARRLGLRHFVGQPYQRIPRYPLLLSEVVKRTNVGIEDRETVQEVIKVCTELGKRIDACMVEGARRLRLLTVQDKIIWKSKEDHQDLKLNEKTRELHYECAAKRKATFDVQSTDLRLFLFDHMLLITKEKRDKQGDKDSCVYQVYKNPIPLELAEIWPDDGKPASLNARESGNGHPKSGLSAASVVADLEGNVGIGPRTSTTDSKLLAPITIQHRGRRGGEFVAYMTFVERDELVLKIAAAKEARQEAVSLSHVFQFDTITEMSTQPSATPTALTSAHPMDGKRVTCSAPYLNVLDGKRRVVVGTESGVYVGMEDDKSNFRLAIKDVNVSAISVLEDYHLLLVLSGKILKAYNISCLEPNSDKAFQIGQQLGKNNVQYFAAGLCAGKTIVITMKKKGAAESHFSVFEPLENAVLGGQHHHKFGLSLGKSKSEWFKRSQEFYVPSDSWQLVMLSKMVCVVCPRGFEILNLENLGEPRVYPTKTEPEYAFLLKRPDSVPVSMFKISTEEFLMCYSDFAFRMTKNGNLAKSELIEFEGRAESFAMVYPYIIAFESELIEIRHIETGELEQLVLGNNIRLLYSDVDLKGNTVIHVHRSDPTQGDVRQVVRLVKATPPPKTPLEPVLYKPKSSYTQTNNTSPPTSSNARIAAPVSARRPTLPSTVYPPVQAQFTSPPAIPQRPSPHLMSQQQVYTPYQPNSTGYTIPQDTSYQQQYGAATPFQAPMPIPMPTAVPMPMPTPAPMPMPIHVPLTIPMPITNTQQSGSIYMPFSPQSQYMAPGIQGLTSPTALSNAYSPVHSNAYSPALSNAYPPALPNAYPPALPNAYPPALPNAYSPALSNAYPPALSNAYSPAFSPTYPKAYPPTAAVPESIGLPNYGYPPVTPPKPTWGTAAFP